MTTLTSLKKYWYWAALVVLSALIASAAFVAPSRISQIELEREGGFEALLEPDRHVRPDPDFVARVQEICGKNSVRLI